MYPETKIYHDGSHFISIPHTEGVSRPKRIEREEEAVVYDDEQPPADNAEDSSVEGNSQETVSEDTEQQEETNKKRSTGETKSQIFNRLYEETRDMKKGQRKVFILKEMRKYFRSVEMEKEYVEKKLERKRLNAINRRMRFTRKANLNEFNYFVTFTRNDELNDESSFKKKLQTCLKNYHSRRGWTYMGVWERSKTGRLHFHAFLNAHDGTMPGEMIKVNDFSFDSGKRQNTTQNSFFNQKFGRSDFKPIPKTPQGKSMALRYLTKYMEKTGEKMVYSRGLPMYLISDIEEKDVVGTMQTEYGEKLILHDKFTCWDEGCYVGEMSSETKKQLRTANH